MPYDHIAFLICSMILRSTIEFEYKDHADGESRPIFAGITRSFMLVPEWTVLTFMFLRRNGNEITNRIGEWKSGQVQ